MTQPCGYQQIVGLAASTALIIPAAGAVPASQQGPTRCIVIAETQAVRWRDDGNAPTATIGYPLAVGAELKYDGDLRRIRFIEQVATATLNVVYMY